MAEKVQYGQTLTLNVTKVLKDVRTSRADIQYLETSDHGNVLFMDAEIQLATSDEYRYHEMLVHPIMKKMNGKELDVLIIGGGDGCAAREVYKWTNVSSVTVVDYDEYFVNEFGRGVLATLNKQVFSRDSIRHVCLDARTFVFNTTKHFDVIFLDLPDPDSPEMVTLYSELIMTLKWLLKDNGGVGMHVGPALLNPNHKNWGMIANFRDMLLHTFNGQNPSVKFNTCYVPSFSNEWAFLHMGIGQYPYDNLLCNDVAKLCRYWTPTCDNTLPLDIHEIYRRRL